MARKLVIGYDGTPEGEDALALARLLGPPLDSQLVAVCDSGAGAVLAGSISWALLQGAPCPVALAPRGYQTWDVDRLRVLGVGFDGSGEAERALDQGSAIGAGIRTRRGLLSVVFRSPDPR